MNVVPLAESQPAEPTPLKRRGVLLGAGATVAAGAVAAIAAQTVPTDATEAVASAPADGDAGYRLTAHVKRYYETARV